MREAAPLDLERQNGARGAGKPRATSSDAVEQPETTAYPNRVVGKIFATWPGVGDITCSGSVINTETDSFVLTASHCLFEDGVFFTNVTFVPGYRRGSRPFGEFPGVQLAVPRLVALGSQLPNDHGSIIVAPSASGQSVEDVVGSFGISLFGSPARAGVRTAIPRIRRSTASGCSRATHPPRSSTPRSSRPGSGSTAR